MAWVSCGLKFQRIPRKEWKMHILVREHRCGAAKDKGEVWTLNTLGDQTSVMESFSL